jgi:hypothetical protein
LGRRSPHPLDACFNELRFNADRHVGSLGVDGRPPGIARAFPV